MDKVYSQLAQKFFKNKKSKNFDFYVTEEVNRQDEYNNEKFLEVYEILKSKFKVVYMLFGEKNFQAIAFEYFQYNPVQSAVSKEYGFSFPKFLSELEQLQDFTFIKWLARVDWFWSTEKNSGKELVIPKGTLNSWANVYKDLPQVDIMLSENEGETIYIEKDGNHYSIKCR